MSERPPSEGRVPPARPSRSALASRTRSPARAPAPELREGARTIALTEADAGSVAKIMAVLPDPAELPPGTLVILPAEVSAARSIARSVLAVFGRTKTVPRALRCSALVARGYVAVGAAEDEGRRDLAWGRSAGRAPVE